MRASAAEMDFQNMQANLKAAGYKKRNVTISSKRAAILGGLSVLPLVAVLAVIYRMTLIDRAHLTDLTGMKFYVTLIAIIAVSVVIHELLHGIGWSFWYLEKFVFVWASASRYKNNWMLILESTKPWHCI